MSEYLRLDIYLNGGHERLISEDSVSEDGFENILNASDVVNGEIAAQLRDTGVARMSTESLTEKTIDILWDIFGKEIKTMDEIDFCMCLWNSDEHIRSAVSIQSIK